MICWRKLSLAELGDGKNVYNEMNHRLDIAYKYYFYLFLVFVYPL